MSSPSQPSRPSISIAYLQLLLEILAERGVAADALLEGGPVLSALLDEPRARMTPRQWSHAILRALALTGEPGLGYEYGLRMRPTVHGVIGYATMSAASLRQSLEISARYFSARQEGFRLEVVEGKEWTSLRISERYHIPQLRIFFYENLLLGLARAMAVLLGRELEELGELELGVDWREPDYHRDWAPRLPAMRFGQRVNEVRIPSAWLELRPVLADPLASRQALSLCERELALAAASEAAVTARVRAALQLEHRRDWPQLEDVARSLGLSARSLKRKLQQEGSSFLLVLEEVKLQEARDLLERSPQPVQAIAERLGYRNPANFTRAFRRWTGETPASYRARTRRGNGSARP